VGLSNIDHRPIRGERLEAGLKIPPERCRKRRAAVPASRNTLIAASLQAGLPEPDLRVS
jgi:hypothetical protein